MITYVLMAVVGLIFCMGLLELIESLIRLGYDIAAGWRSLRRRFRNGKPQRA